MGLRKYDWLACDMQDGTIVTDASSEMVNTGAEAQKSGRRAGCHQGGICHKASAPDSPQWEWETGVSAAELQYLLPDTGAAGP